MIGCAFNTLLIEELYHMVEPAFPKLFEPCSIAEPADKRGTDGVIDIDERPAIPRFSQRAVAETPQCPDLRTVVGPIDTGCDVTALGCPINSIFDFI